MCRDDALLLTFPAVVTAPASARRSFRRWLAVAGWPLDDAEDLVLVVSEAVSNSVEHGYRVRHGAVDGLGTGHLGAGDAISVRAAIETDPAGDRRLRLEVADRGRWREPPPHPMGRRRGLALIGQVAEHVQIDAGPDGTTLTIRTRSYRPL